MAIVKNQNDGIERVQVATGDWLDDAASPEPAEVEIGFRARRVEAHNVDDGTMLLWIEGMADDSAIKTAADGTRSVVSSGGISVSDRKISFPVTQNQRVRWVAMG